MKNISLSTARRLQKNVRLFTDERYAKVAEDVSVNIGCIQRQTDLVIAIKEKDTVTIKEILCL